MIVQTEWICEMQSETVVVADAVSPRYRGMISNRKIPYQMR